MNKYAVLIGNSQFPDEADKSKLPDLACPEQDVDQLGKVLASERGEFTVLPLKNQPSTQIKRELQRTVNKAQQDDLLLFYYSGHGKPNKAGILHLTTYDTVISELETSSIPINHIYDILGTGKCRKIVIILDCCYSGAAGQGFKGAVDDYLQQMNNSRGTYLVTASTELQVAHESAAEGLSLFTKHLIAGLETGDADKDGDGWVDMNELYDYVQSKVMAENPAQQPTKHVKEERGGLIIAKSGRDSKAERLRKIKSFFHDLAQEDRITNDILFGVLELLKRSPSEISVLEQQQYALVIGIFEHRIMAVEFVRKWDRLVSEIGKIEQKKATQEQLARDKEAQEKAARKKFTEEEKISSPPEQPKKWKKYLAWTSFVVVISAVFFFVYSYHGPSVPSVEHQKQQQEAEVKRQAATESQKSKIIEPEMVAIKGGCFSMGSPDSEKERGDDEKQHKVCVEDFALGKTEVTKGQFNAFVSATSYQTETEIGDGCYGWTGTDWKKDKKYNWRNVGFTQTDEHPVVCVSWNDAMAYIAWLSKTTGKDYRLPTEAQWEYAARAGTDTLFYTGKCISTTQANYNGNYPYDNCAKTGIYKKQTVAVGSYPANPWRLADMAGNVWEWTCSLYNADYSGSEQQCASKDDAGTRRVLRGGSWIIYARSTRSANRHSLTPGYRNNLIGFRFALGQ